MYANDSTDSMSCIIEGKLFSSQDFDLSMQMSKLIISGPELQN